MFEGFDSRQVIGFLLLGALYWGLGYAAQGLAHLAHRCLPPENRDKLSRGCLDEFVEVSWYWRLLLGYPPTKGKVAIRPAVFQILAILMVVVGLIAAPLIGPSRFLIFVGVSAVLVWIFDGLIVAFVLPRMLKYEE